MDERLRFYLDEHVPLLVAEGLRRRGIDVVTTAEAGLLSANDKTQLEYARDEGRLLVTHDADFLRLHGQGLRHAGIAYCHQGTSTAGQMIRTLILLHEVLSPEEVQGKVEFI